jgi:hypothetical protein
MEEENITRLLLAGVCEDQEERVIALRMLFSAADSKLEEQRIVAESIRLIMAFQAHIDLRREALDLLAWQIIRLREIAQRQHALLREWPDPLEEFREAARVH